MHDKEVFKHGIPPGKTMLGTEARDTETGAIPTDTAMVKEDSTPSSPDFYAAIAPLTDTQVTVQGSEIRMNGTFSLDQLRTVTKAFDEYLRTRR